MSRNVHGVKPAESDPLADAYTSAWARRTALNDDSLQILYTAMHQADLDRFLVIDNPVLEFATQRWERGTAPEQFGEDLRRNALLLYARIVRNAVATTARAVRTIMRAPD